MRLSYRATYTTIPPAHAERRAVKGRTLVRWTGRGGKRVEGVLLPNGRVAVEVTDVWCYEYTDEHGRRCRRKGLADRAATESLARQAQTAADRIRAGLDAPADPAGQGATLAALLADYLQYLRDKGRTKTHVADVGQRVRYVLTATAAKAPADLTEAALARALGRLRRDGHTDKLGRVQPVGPATANGYAGSVKAFLTWLKRNRLSAVNPLADLVRENDKSDVRRKRRRLTDPEFERVLAAAAVSRPKKVRPDNSPHGESRAVLYLVAAYTGFRAGELGHLDRAAFRLDHATPHVRLPGAATKNGEEALIPLPAAVVGRVRAWLATRPARGPVWPGKWPRRAAGLLRRDLAAAGVPYRDDRGRYADFHSLRRTYIRKLRDAGVHPKDAQRLARHSTITLTLDVYEDDAELTELGAAVAGLPGPARLADT